MIPKIIHYVWVGPQKKNKRILKNIESWKKYLPNYEMQEWNEKNFDISKSPEYVKKAYERKKWAFVSDYIRLHALYTKGGVYLDTDMEIIKNIDLFLENQIFFGYESLNLISMGIIGAIPQHWFIKDIMDHYKNIKLITNFIVITFLTTDLYSQLSGEKKKEITLYPTNYFYPVSYDGAIINFDQNTYTIHKWDHSWGSWGQKIKGRLSRKGKVIRRIIRIYIKIETKIFNYFKVITNLLKN